MDGSEKRLYVVTSTTPNKPSEKRTREQEQPAEQPNYKKDLHVELWLFERKEVLRKRYLRYLQ